MVERPPVAPLAFWAQEIGALGLNFKKVWTKKPLSSIIPRFAEHPLRQLVLSSHSLGFFPKS
jgi:hypothetical protein